MRKNDFTVTNPTLPPEDKPNTTLIKMLIILAIVGGIGWFIYKKNEDGSLTKFVDSVVEELKDDEDEDNNHKLNEKVTPSSTVSAELEEYLSKEYNDSCTYSEAVEKYKFPESDAIGGLFTCRNINGEKVFAYMTYDEEDSSGRSFRDGYLYAKYRWLTRSSFRSTVKLYFKEAEVELDDSNYGISTGINKNISYSNFIKENGFTYDINVSLPRGTAISVNTLTDMARHLSSVAPNFNLDAYYKQDINDNPLDDDYDSTEVFSITCENGKASVKVNQ